MRRVLRLWGAWDGIGTLALVAASVALLVIVTANGLWGLMFYALAGYVYLKVVQLVWRDSAQKRERKRTEREFERITRGA